MPNYVTTIIKIFVPGEVEKLIPQVLAGLAHANLDIEGQEGDSDKWMDFGRLLPSPDFGEDMPLYSDAEGIVEMGRWPIGLERPEDLGKDRETMLSVFSALSSEHASAGEMVVENMRRWGVTNRLAWQEEKWGVKWNAITHRPIIKETPEEPPYDGYEGCRMIQYNVTTGWNAPLGYLRALSELCEAHGIGMKVWYEDEDEGNFWDPISEEYRTHWKEDGSFEVGISEMSASARMLLHARGFVVTASETASSPIDTNSQRQMLIRGMTSLLA